MAGFFGQPDPGGGAGQALLALAARSGIPAEVISAAANGARSLPGTRARLSHAYALKTSANRTIGAVFRTDHKQIRDATFKYAIDPMNNGRPAALVPGNITDQSLQIARFDLYDEVLEETFTDFEMVMLTDQRRGFKLREIWRAPTNLFNSQGRVYEYRTVYFTDIGRRLDAEGDRTVRVDASLKYLERIRVA